MRSLVAGQPETLAEVTYAVENARGNVAGTAGRVDNAFDALDLLDGDPTILFLEVSGAGDPQLGQVRTLMTRGARVIILAKEPSAELRIAAVKSGAREVFFAPWTPARVQARLDGAGVGTGFADKGTPVDFRAILLPEGTKEQITARATSLFPTGLAVETGGRKIARDSVVRVAIQTPPPHRVPVLFARVLTDGSQSSTLLRFIGLTAEEESLVQQVIRSGEEVEDDGSTRIGVMLPGDVTSTDARNAIGRVIADLDSSVLRSAPSKWLGLTLPALTDAERVAMVKGGPLSDVAVWRTRAHVIASILESSPELATSDLPFEEWRQGLADARGLIRSEVSRRMTEGDAALLRETRDVQARLNAVSDRIDRLTREAGIEVVADSGPLESPQAGPATFERPAPPAAVAAAAPAASRPDIVRSGPSRLRTGILVCLGIAALAGGLAVRHSTQARRSVDIGRTGVASRPIVVGDLRVRSHFREPNGSVIVVDRSWYDHGYDASAKSRGDAARRLAKHFGREGRVIVRDYAGRAVADTDDGLEAAPLATGSAATPASTSGSLERPPPVPASPRANGPAPAPASPSR